MARHLEKFGTNQILNIHIMNSNWKPHLNLLKVLDVSLEMSHDPKIISALHKTNWPSSCWASHRPVSVISQGDYQTAGHGLK